MTRLRARRNSKPFNAHLSRASQPLTSFALLFRRWDFQQQSHVEWLKLIFIPAKLRQSARQRLACSSCDPRLQETHKTLETRREALLKSAIRLNSFREKVLSNEPPSIFDTIKAELRTNLKDNEWAIVEENWEDTLQDIQERAKKIAAYEQMAKESGHLTLITAIQRTGISFSSDTIENFVETLEDAIDINQSSKIIRDRLNTEFGLDLSEEDARMIKQEAYINKILAFAPELSKKLAEKLFENKIIFAGWDIVFTLTQDASSKLDALLKQYKKSHEELDLKNIMGFLRELGIDPAHISDKELIKWIETKFFTNTVFAAGGALTSKSIENLRHLLENHKNSPDKSRSQQNIIKFIRNLGVDSTSISDATLAGVIDIDSENLQLHPITVLRQ